MGGIKYIGSECLTCTIRAVVAHTCHGHRCQPSLVPLSGTGKKRGRGGDKGGL